MKRWLRSIALLMVMGIFMVGCSSKTVEFDGAGFISEVTALELEDQLVAIPEKTAETFYNLSAEGIQGYTLYGSGTRATATEVMVIELSDVKYAEEVTKILEKRREDLKKEYQDYIASEVTRIDDGILTTVGNHVILAITGSNEQVQQLIDTHTTEK